MTAVTKSYLRGQPYDGSWWTTDPVNGKVPLDYEFSGVVPWTNTKTGENLPGWRKLIAQSKDATTTFNGYKREVRDVEEGYFDVTYLVTIAVPYYPWTEQVPKTYSFQGMNQGAFFNNMPGDASAAEQQALMQLYKRIRKNHQSFSGLTFLGELREAISMIRRPAKSLSKGLSDYISALKRRSRGVPFSKSGNLTRKRILSDTWLEFSFGWRPLISDIQSGAEALARWKVGVDGKDERRYRISAQGESSDASIGNEYAIPEFFWSNIRIYRNTNAYGTSTVRYIARLSYETAVPVGSAKRLAQLSGFTLIEFIPTAWELLPWSFLVDYFTNVGDVLEAFATPTNNVYSITKTTRTNSYQNYLTRLDLVSILAASNYISHKESPGGFCRWKAFTTTFQRTAVPSLDLPRFSLENPFGKNAVNRLLNIVALSAGARPLKPFYR